MKEFTLTAKDCKEAQESLFTLIDFLRWTVSQFNKADLSYGHGTENSWDEAFYLVLSLLKLPHDLNEALFSANLLPDEKKTITEKVRSRINERIPTAYLLKEAWFAGLNFYVDERVIVPRSPMAELLAEKELSPWVEPQAVSSVLDLCTGSGCIAIVAAMVFADATIEAVDLSAEALEVAAINVARYGLEENVTLTKSNLFSALGDKQYDLILSNPPYVPREEYESLATEYQHEPQMALEAGEDGLSIVSQILQKAAKHLTPTGTLIVEVGDLKETVEAAYPHIPFTWLPCDNGGEGIFLLTASELLEAAPIKPMCN